MVFRITAAENQAVRILRKRSICQGTEGHELRPQPLQESTILTVFKLKGSILCQCKLHLFHGLLLRSLRTV